MSSQVCVKLPLYVREEKGFVCEKGDDKDLRVIVESGWVCVVEFPSDGVWHHNG